MAACLGIAHGVQAATITVCNSGCDYQTIVDAISAPAAVGDTITVGADYASTTEVFPFNLPTGVTIDCENSGAIIGQDDDSFSVNINGGIDGALRNCIFSNMQQQNTGANNMTIANNEFRGNSRVTADAASNIYITGNTIHQSVNAHDVQNLVVENNTIIVDPTYTESAINIGNVTGASIKNNIIQNSAVNKNFFTLVDIGGTNTDIEFATNTLETPFLETSDGGDFVTIRSEGVFMHGNTMYLRSQTPPGNYINAIHLDGNSGPVSAVITHNTVKFAESIQRGGGLTLSDWNSYPINVTTTYNLFAGDVASSTAQNYGFGDFNSGPSSNLNVFSEYNGFGNLNGTDSSNVPAGPGSVINKDPAFRTQNLSTSDDFQLAPFSDFLDINGSEDIGAFEGVRGTFFRINATGPVNYLTIDATNTQLLVQHFRTGDGVEVAAGTYEPFTLQSGPRVTGDLTFTGAGPTSTIFSTTSTGSVISLNGLSQNQFSNFSVQNASSSFSVSYLLSRMQMAFGPQNYDEAGMIGLPNGVIIMTSAPSGFSCTTDAYDADNKDVTSLIDSTPGNWNAALVTYVGIHLTVIGPSAYLSAPSAIEGCASPGLIVTEHFMTDIFTDSAGEYTYNAAGVALAGFSLKAGETDPAYLTRAASGGNEGGLVLINTNNSTFENISLENNVNGMILSGSSQGNMIRDASFTGSTASDIKHLGSGDNVIANTSFDRAKVAITSTGTISVQQKTRAFVQDESSMAQEGISVTYTSANGASTTVLTTDSLGYTPYITAPAFLMTSTSAALTNGGFNPYTIVGSATGTLLSTSTLMTLQQPNQLVSLTMRMASISGGNSGGGALPSTSGSSTIIPLPIPTDTGMAQIPSLQSLGLTIHDLVKLKDDNNPNTQEDTTVYYIGADGLRHAFPGNTVYFSWYCDFSRVKTVSANVMGQIGLGKNITYRPGLRLVKFRTDPKVYLVQTNRTLRPIQDEATARALRGTNWSKQVLDINDAFYGDYQVGAPILIGDVGNPTAFQSNANYPSSQMEIVGYRDPVGSQLNACTMEEVSGADLTSKPWPFKEFSPYFQFTIALAPNSNDTKEIRALQEVLIFLGDTQLSVTGIYGSQTISAVRRFQVKRGMKSTGTVGPSTRAALNEIVNAAR